MQAEAVSGQTVLAEVTENEYKMATIIEIRGPPQEYYVHFIGSDRRLDKWLPLQKLVTKINGKPIEEKETHVTRNQDKKKGEVMPNEASWMQNPMIMKQEGLFKDLTKVKNIEKIIFGRFEIDSWYFSPYPEPLGQMNLLYICEYCIKYMCKKITYLKHVRICPYTVPPGTKVYEDCKLDCPPTFSNCTSISIYEIDGKDSKLYCQNLCLLSKLFLDHKTLYFDVTPFVFYVLTENEANGRAHVVGYFSKDKKMNNNCNLSCILILPPFQKKGYGKLLIAFSYYLSRKTDQLCGPEKPLSDMGKLSYISYWKELIFEVLKDCKPPKTPPSLRELSRITRLKEDDIKIALGTLKMIKYWKSEYIIEADIIKEINSYFKSKEDDAKRPDQRKAVFKADSIMLK